MAARLLRLPATLLPLPLPTKRAKPATNVWVEEALSRLGYPGFAYRRKPGAIRNPAEVLLRALTLDDLDPRLAEALPWLLLRFEGFDVEALVEQAKAKDLQNRLGFTVALSREVAERMAEFKHRAADLRRLESALDVSRLAREDTYGRREVSGRLRAWLRENRSDPARHWNLLTDLKVEHLPYGGQDPGPLAELPS